MFMSEKTSINFSKGTLKKLKKLKITKRESYDEIVNRLIKSFKEKKKK